MGADGADTQNLSLEEKNDLLIGTAVKDQSLEEKFFVIKNGHETTLKFNMERENPGFQKSRSLFKDLFSTSMLNLWGYNLFINLWSKLSH